MDGLKRPELKALALVERRVRRSRGWAAGFAISGTSAGRSVMVGGCGSDSEASQGRRRAARRHGTTRRSSSAAASGLPAQIRLV